MSQNLPRNLEHFIKFPGPPFCHQRSPVCATVHKPGRETNGPLRVRSQMYFSCDLHLGLSLIKCRRSHSHAVIITLFNDITNDINTINDNGNGYRKWMFHLPFVGDCVQLSIALPESGSFLIAANCSIFYCLNSKIKCAPVSLMDYRNWSPYWQL